MKRSTFALAKFVMLCGWLLAGYCAYRYFSSPDLIDMFQVAAAITILGMLFCEIGVTACIKESGLY